MIINSKFYSNLPLDQAEQKHNKPNDKQRKRNTKKVFRISPIGNGKAYDGSQTTKQKNSKIIIFHIYNSITNSLNLSPLSL